jgi:hypothetical protein
MQSVFVDKEEFLQFDILICPVPGCNCLWHKPCGQEIPEDGVHECDGSSQFNDLMKEEGWKYCPGETPTPPPSVDIHETDVY